MASILIHVPDDVPYEKKMELIGDIMAQCSEDSDGRPWSPSGEEVGIIGTEGIEEERCCTT